MTKEAKLAKVLDLQKELDERKKLYDELDKLVIELQQEGFTQAEYEGFNIELVDNFEAKNTVFRVAGVKRYELKIKEAK